MKKFVPAIFLSILFAVQAFAVVPKVNHPKAIHATNPYLKHPNHRAVRHHHKKI
jgi:hypothetical protein